MNQKNPLLLMRKKINSIDKKIINLLKKRETASKIIAKIKKDYNLPIRDEKREKKIIKKIKKKSKEKKIESIYLKKIFKLIIKRSVILQKLYINKKKKKYLSYSYLGPKRSYSYFALKKYESINNLKIKKIPFLNFKKVIQAVEKKKTDHAIIPIENNFSGLINQTFKILCITNVYILDEIYFPINHCLIVQKNQKTKIKDLKTIYSHIQPKIQCKNFIKKNLLNAKFIETRSTSEAIQIISKKHEKKIAAIGSSKAAKINGLKILKKNISNKKKNTTRFLILSKKAFFPKKKKNFKTTIILHIDKNKKKIAKILSLFEKENIKINIIFPKKKKNFFLEKKIYMDIYPIQNNNTLKKILKKLKSIVFTFKVLGVYSNKK